MKIRHSKLAQTLVNSQAYINRPIQTLSTTLGPTPQCEQLGNRASLTYQDSSSEQLGLQDQARDCLPPSATKQTS